MMRSEGEKDPPAALSPDRQYYSGGGGDGMDRQYYMDLLRRVDTAVVDSGEQRERVADRQRSGFQSDGEGREDEEQGMLSSMMVTGQGLDGGDEEAGETFDHIPNMGLFTFLRTVLFGAPKTARHQRLHNQDEEQRSDLTKCIILFFSDGVPASLRKMLAVSVMSGLMVGLHAAALANTSSVVSKERHLKPDENNVVIGWLLIGLALGALFTGFISDKYGRRVTLVSLSLVTLPLTVPHITHSSFLSDSIPFLAFSLCTCAFMAVGFLLSGGLYSFELAHASIRHHAYLSLMLIAMIAFTVVRVITYDGWLPHGPVTVGWLGLALSFITCVCVSWLPDSPVWLAANGRIADAHASVRMVYNFSVNDSNPLLDQELTALPLYAGIAGRRRRRDPEDDDDITPSNEMGEHDITDDGPKSCLTSLSEWRPVISLLSSIITAAHSAGGLQVFVWTFTVFLRSVALTDAATDFIRSLSLLLAGCAGVTLTYLLGTRRLLILSTMMLCTGSLIMSLLLLLASSTAYYAGPHEAYKGDTYRLMVSFIAAPAALLACLGWILVTFILCPLIVSESSPARGRGRSLAAMAFGDVIYGPLTMLMFKRESETPTGELSGTPASSGLALLLLSLIGGGFLLILVVLFAVDTSKSKDPLQVRREVLNRIGFVFFHFNSFIRGTPFERCVSSLSYTQLSTNKSSNGHNGHSPLSQDDEDEMDVPSEGEGLVGSLRSAVGLTPNKMTGRSFVRTPRSSRGGDVAEESDSGMDDSDSYTTEDEEEAERRKRAEARLRVLARFTDKPRKTKEDECAHVPSANDSSKAAGVPQEDPKDPTNDDKGDSEPKSAAHSAKKKKKKNKKSKKAQQLSVSDQVPQSEDASVSETSRMIPEEDEDSAAAAAYEETRKNRSVIPILPSNAPEGSAGDRQKLLSTQERSAAEKKFSSMFEDY